MIGKKKRVPASLLILFLSVVFSVCLVIVAGDLIEATKLLGAKFYGQETKAIIIDKTTSSEGRRLIYRYNVHGEDYEQAVPSRSLWENVDVGTVVSVKYRENTPSISVLTAEHLRTGGALFKFLLSVTFMGLVGYSLYKGIFIHRTATEG